MPIDSAKGCKANPAVVDKCFSVAGQVSVYNGTPAVRIAPNGGKRLLGVLPSENEIMPAQLKERISPDRGVFAEMEVCPFSKRKPGHMQFVCVESAKNVTMERP
jgi:hypothetical protein